MAISPRKLKQRRLEAARGYLQLDLPERAIDELARIPSRFEEEFETMLLKAECHRELEEHSTAMRFFVRCRDLRPENLQCMLGMAWCLKRLDRLSEAIDVLEEARSFHPDEPIVIYNLACYFSLCGNKPKAIECLGRSLRMEPDLTRLIPEETDFDSLREDPDFRFIVTSVQSGDNFV